MGYLEQSTRYVFYGDKPGGRYRYYRDPAVLAGPHRDEYLGALDGLFDAYTEAFEAVRAMLQAPLAADDKAARSAARAAALDVARGLLPAATVSNVGIFGSPQAYEQLILRMRSHELPEARAYAELLLAELKKVIPDFLTRLDRPERGGVWAEYREGRSAALEVAATSSTRLPAPWRRRRALHPPAALDPGRRGRHHRRCPLPPQPPLARLHPRPGQGPARRPPARTLRRRRGHPPQPPPPPRPRVGGRRLRVRGRLGLRRLPRSPAPPPAHHRVAATGPGAGL